MLEANQFTPVDNNSFIGIKVINNKIHFFYPQAFQLSDDLRKDALNLLRTFKLAYKRSPSESNYNSKFTSEEIYPLNSYFWILNDFFENKRYINKEKVLRYGVQGRIEWNRTIRRIPYFSNNSFVFPVLISEVSKQRDNILTEIYAYCVNKEIEEVGWYYDIVCRDDSLGTFHYNKAKYLSVLNEEIHSAFDDKKRQRLIHMKNIITGLDDKNINSRNFVRGVDSYEHIFEAMVDKMFGNVEFKKQFFPNGSWDLVASGHKESSKLRPDTIVLKDRKAYIIDSKYYKYGITFDPNDLPNTTSIEKQITYGEFAEKLIANQGTDVGYDEVYNAFIIPYSKTDNIHSEMFNDDLVFVGTASANWPLASSSCKKIATILIDLRFLIENYLKYNDKNIDDLTTIITNNL